MTQQNVGTALLGSPQIDQTQPANFVQTQVLVMRSPTIAQDAIRSLGLKTTPSALAKRVTVGQEADTNIVTISVTDTSSVRAADTANAIARAYVDWSQGLQRSSIKAAADDVQHRLTLAQQSIATPWFVEDGATDGAARWCGCRQGGGPASCLERVSASNDRQAPGVRGHFR